MRVAYVCADLGVPVFGRKGCSIHVQEIVRALLRLGAVVDLFTPYEGGSPPRGLEDVRVHRILVGPSADRATRERAAVAANCETRALLEREGPFDLVYERYSLWSFAGMEFARAKGLPGLLEVNAPLIEEEAEYRHLCDRAMAEYVADRTFAAATNLIAVSAEVGAYLQHWRTARGRVHVVSNGVDPERFPRHLPASNPGHAGSFTVGFVGSLKPWHGLRTLLDAFALFHRERPQGRLLIVGDGPEAPFLAMQAASRQLAGAVALTGSVAAESVPGLLASMDVAVAPYSAASNFYFSPLKVYEYMAAGLPVVASRVGQLADLIEHEKTGLLFAPDDPAELAACLRRLHDDRSLVNRLGRAARKMVRLSHTWKGVAHRILRLAACSPAASPCNVEAIT